MDLARNLKIDSLSRLHPTPPRQIRPDQPVADAVALMRQERVGCLLVCEESRVVGIFTERDLMRRVLAKQTPLSTPIAQCMTPDPVTVDRLDSIAVAIRHMEDGGYRHLPVVADGKPIGILSVKRIVHFLVEHFPGIVYNLPPDERPAPRKREGA